MNDNDIIHAVNLYRADWIVLTGGEPSLQIDSQFLYLLRRATGKKIAIETNGTTDLPDGLDWITVSPKEEISGEPHLPLRVRYANEIKVVDLGQPLEPYFSLECRKESTLMYLQPCYVPDEEEYRKNVLNTVSHVFADPRWTLSVQLHRFFGIP